MAMSIGVLLISTVSSAQQEAEGRVLRDLVYAEVDGKPLLLDLYLPKPTDTPVPLVIWVHGGAWRGGDKQPCPAEWLVAHGYAVASIAYRLSQVAIFPAQIEDCRAAVRWLRGHAAEYGYMPDRIGAWGASAGGHLVALLGTASDQTGWNNVGEYRDQSSGVQAVCDFFGPSDFLQMDAGGSNMVHDAPNSPESRLIGGPIQEHPGLVAVANPITYVTPDDPPFLILHGDQDRTVPINQSELLHAALTKAGVDSTFQVVRGAGHGFGGPEIREQVRRFFDRRLKQQAPVSAPNLPFQPRRLAGPRRPITDAPFVQAMAAGDHVHAQELVIGVQIGDKARAYPINMLTGPSREIINDTLGGIPIAATW